MTVTVTVTGTVTVTLAVTVIVTVIMTTITSLNYSSDDKDYYNNLSRVDCVSFSLTLSESYH